MLAVKAAVVGTIPIRVALATTLAVMGTDEAEPPPAITTVLLFLPAAVVAGLGSGCDGSSAKHEDDLDGVATIALTASSGVGSVRTEFKGATRTIIRCLAIDGAPTTRPQGLPTGSVTVSASSFSSTDCTGDATWIADDQTVQLSKGQVVAIQIVFRPNGIVTINTSYVDDVPPGGLHVSLGEHRKGR
jgi:hypothetical protein